MSPVDVADFLRRPGKNFEEERHQLQADSIIWRGRLQV